MSKIEQADRPRFTRAITVAFDGDERPEYSDRFSGKRGRAVRVRLAYTYQFRTSKWTEDVAVYWHWTLASGDLGQQERRDMWPKEQWVLDLVEEHRPATTITFKENI